MINISLRVKNLINRHETRDPKRIAKDLNIHVRYLPYETTKGYFIKIKGNKFIIALFYVTLKSKIKRRRKQKDMNTTA